jgi:hypothetical protein
VNHENNRYRAQARELLDSEEEAAVGEQAETSGILATAIQNLFCGSAAFIIHVQHDNLIPDFGEFKHDIQ